MPSHKKEAVMKSGTLKYYETELWQRSPSYS
jgi:hypothetical protein